MRKTWAPSLRTIWLILSVAAWFCHADSARAVVQPNHLFARNMVLQHGVEIPVWGTAEPGETVTVTLAGQSATATADKDGFWIVRLRKMEPGGPYAMKFSGSKTPGRPKEIDQIRIGEVWLIVGDSNADLSVNNCDERDKVLGTIGNFKNIYLYRTPPLQRRFPQTQVGNRRGQGYGVWSTSERAIVGQFSAVGIMFARELASKLPPSTHIGIIQSSESNTPAETWMPRSAFACRPELQTRLDNFDRQVKQYFEVGLPHHLKDLEKYLADHPKNDAAKLDIPIPAPPVNPGHVPTNPTTCFNGMVASVAPYPIKGILYYQDARSQNDAWLYRYIFDEIIQDYRKLWNNPDLPFVFAQTTPVGKPVTIPGESRWAELRESQLYRFKKIRNTGMAVGIDAGGDDDVEPIPRSKEKLSKRLAWAALGLFYDGVEQMPSGPIYDGHRINNERVTIQFTYTGKGLMPVFKESDKERKLRGFTICGEDRKWVVADARIEGDTVVVSSPSVPRPVAVRYAWADNPADANLYNKDGLPASPFRTDTFKLTTQP